MKLHVLILLSFTSAAIGSLSGRTWGNGYILLFALLPMIHVLASEKRIWASALATAILAIPMMVVAGEGLLNISWLFFLLLVFSQITWYLLPGAGVALVRRKWGMIASVLSLPIFWTATEFLAGSTFLWKNYANPASIAYSQTDTLLLQAAHFSSTSAVVFLVFFISVGIYLLVRGKTPFPFLIGLILVSTAFLPRKTTVQTEENTLEVAVIQGAITNAETIIGGFDYEMQSELIKRYEQLTFAALEQNPNINLIVWPESSMPMAISGNSLDGRLSKTLANFPLVLLGGSYYAWGNGYNVAMLWQDNRLNNVYYKQSPVPITEAWVTSGYYLEPPLVAGARVALAICMESTYPALLRKSVLDGADLLIVLANATALGGANTPELHLRAASLRAVETGRWVIHASQSGYSAFVDPTGKVIVKTISGQTFLTNVVQKTTTHTPFIVFGNWLGLVALAIALLLLIPFGLLFRLLTKNRSLTKP